MNTRIDNTRSTVTIACALLLGLWAFAPAGQAVQTGNERVEICHFPPGNPANLHTITVSSNAVQKHIDKHGDVVGPCCDLDDLCDDSDACTANFCIDGACTSEPADCEDSVDCTDDSCDSNDGCSHVPNDANCGEGAVCDPSAGCVSECPKECMFLLDNWTIFCQPGGPAGLTCDTGDVALRSRCTGSTLSLLTTDGGICEVVDNLGGFLFKELTPSELAGCRPIFEAVIETETGHTCP